MRKSSIVQIETIKYHCISVTQCAKIISFVQLCLHSVLMIWGMFWVPADLRIVCVTSIAGSNYSND